MARIHPGARERPVMWLRMITETARAVVSGVLNAALRRSESPAVSLKVGDPAPDFVLPASDGRTYRLSDFRGQKSVVVAWFPKAFTGGCTAECRSLGATRAAIERLDVQCFAASIDPRETNAEFARALGVDYPILSDATRTVARAYGVLGAGGFASRWTFYIGRDGRILHIDKQVHAASHGSDVVARLSEVGLS